MGAVNRFEALASLAKVLSCEVRLELLGALRPGPAKARELAERLELDVTLISHHLRTLREGGLVASVGRGVYALTAAAEALAGVEDVLARAAGRPSLPGSEQEPKQLPVSGGAASPRSA